MIYEYIWVDAPEYLPVAPVCKSRPCAKAHYGDGQPKQKMRPLKVVPFRKHYLRLIFFCPRCKTIKPDW